MLGQGREDRWLYRVCSESSARAGTPRTSASRRSQPLIYRYLATGSVIRRLDLLLNFNGRSEVLELKAVLG